MAKFCRGCGNPLEEGVQFCKACGAQVNAPVAPAPVQEEESFDWKGLWSSIVSKVKSIDTKKLVAAYRSYLPLLLVEVMILCLFLGISSCFGTYPVNGVIYDEDHEELSSGYAELTDVYEEMEDVDGIGGLKAVNIIFGILNILMAVLVVMPFFSFFKKVKALRMAVSLYAPLGFIINLLHLILFAICGTFEIKALDITYAFSIPGLIWVAVIAFAVLTVFGNVLPSLKQKTAAPVQPAE